jgi:hypothetical protein
VNHLSGIEQQGKRRTKLGHISSWFLWQVLRGACFVYRFHHIVFLVLSHALATTYIYFHSKLVFPGGVLSKVMLTKNTCVLFSCMLRV